jgi:hypothetical protein
MRQLIRRKARVQSLPPLPPAILDHLEQKLRAAYYERSDKPKYLGNSALPLEFDPYLYRLEHRTERRIQEVSSWAEV